MLPARSKQTHKQPPLQPRRPHRLIPIEICSYHTLANIIAHVTQGRPNLGNDAFCVIGTVVGGKLVIEMWTLNVTGEPVRNLVISIAHKRLRKMLPRDAFCLRLIEARPKCVCGRGSAQPRAGQLNTLLPQAP